VFVHHIVRHVRGLQNIEDFPHITTAEIQNRLATILGNVHATNIAEEHTRKQEKTRDTDPSNELSETNTQVLHYASRGGEGRDPIKPKAIDPRKPQAIVDPLFLLNDIVQARLNLIQVQWTEPKPGTPTL
jgi:hypothetical protein